MTIESHLRGARPVLSIADFNSITPDNGMEVGVWIPASVSLGDIDVLWYFRYRALNPDGSANSPSDGHLWDYIGGVPAFQSLEAMDSYSPGSTNWVNNLGSGPGPDLHFPIDGRYTCALGAQINSNANGNYAMAGLSNNTADPADSTTIISTTTLWVTASRIVDLLGVHAQRLRMMYRTDHTGGTTAFQNRWIQMTPVRVG